MVLRIQVLASVLWRVQVPAPKLARSDTILREGGRQAKREFGRVRHALTGGGQHDADRLGLGGNRGP